MPVGAYSVHGDWGTSRLRLFRVEHGVVTDRVEGPGIGTPGLAAEAVLRAALANWRAVGEPCSIRLCGMVGARGGWVEVPYVDCPAGAAAWLAGAFRRDLDGIPVAVMAGVADGGTTAPDVMRGEETQVFGALLLMPELAQGAQSLVLPGTHNKWVLVRDGRITRFHTVPTGELFAALRDHSILARGTPSGGDAAECAGFAEGLERARSDQRLMTSLFAARAMQLQAGRSVDWAIGYLSGLLIGCELAEMRQLLGTLDSTTVIGDARLADRYTRAFATYGIAVRRADGDACALAGLSLEGPA